MKVRAVFFLFLLLTLPAEAHHTKEHILGAPSAPVVTAPADAAGLGAWWALGPFFALAILGVLRWGYRHHRDGKHRNPRG